jgi:hypothetical protein
VATLASASFRSLVAAFPASTPVAPRKSPKLAGAVMSRLIVALRVAASCNTASKFMALNVTSGFANTSAKRLDTSCHCFLQAGSARILSSTVSATDFGHVVTPGSMDAVSFFRLVGGT